MNMNLRYTHRSYSVLMIRCVYLYVCVRCAYIRNSFDIHWIGHDEMQSVVIGYRMDWMGNEFILLFLPDSNFEYNLIWVLLQWKKLREKEWEGDGQIERSHSRSSLSCLLLVFQLHAAAVAVVVAIIVVVTAREREREFISARKEKYQIRLQRKRVVTMTLFAGRCRKSNM